MTVRITSMTDAETTSLAPPDDDAGLGALRTDRGNLPLDRIAVRAEITGLTSRVELTQDFVNTFDVPLEAGYVFPLPDRGAVTRMQMIADGRIVDAELQERETARRAYDDAVARGSAASIAEEERPDVFTIRVGNIAPGERVSIALTLVCPLAYQDGEATFRFPLVVAPRYIPGSALADIPVGDGYADDTDAVPDASRITPPVLLPGFPYPVSLAIDVGIDPAGLTLTEARSNLPAAPTDGPSQGLRILPGERADQDFVLRLRYGGDGLTDALVLVPDADGDEGTYQLTVLPPASSAPPRPRDLVLLLDTSGSMNGWKMVTARRAAARIVDSLTAADRFAVLTFDERIHHPAGLPAGLVEATDRNRYRAIEHLARIDAAGGTEMLAPLRKAFGLLTGSPDRDAIVVLVTDGQVGNEDQLLRGLTRSGVRVHAVGIDQAVNAGFLGRLVSAGGGRCELVESEDRLDEAMAAMHRRIGAPLAHSLTLAADGLAVIKDTTSPARLPDLFPGVPLVVSGRYRSSSDGSLALRGTAPDGTDWSVTAAGQRRESTAVTTQWARAHLRDLEDRYAAGENLAQRIVDTSLRFGVLSRFTGYVGVGSRRVSAGTQRHHVLQPVELPAGWNSDAEPHRQTDSDQPRPEVKPRQARTVKLRNVVAVAVAGVLLLGSGWFVALGRDDQLAATRDRGAMNTVAPSRPEPPAGKVPADNTTFRGGTAEMPVPAQAPAPPQSPTTVPRDIVTTGSMQMVVDDPTQVADRLVSAVTDGGGRVDSRSERSASSSPHIDLVLRIPADRLDGVLADAKKLGTVDSMTIRHTDVTSQRVDLDARVQALQTSIDRLLELMRRANSTSDLLSAESTLTQRQAELDSIRAQRAALGDEISYATIDVHLSAMPAVPRSGSLGALEQGWHSLVSAVEGLMLTVAFLLPWLVVLGVLGLISYVVVRRVRANRRPAHAGAGQENPESQ